MWTFSASVFLSLLCLTSCSSFLLPYSREKEDFSGPYESYFWKYTKSFTDFSDPSRIENYFTNVRKKRLSMVVKKGTQVFRSSYSAGKVTYNFFLRTYNLEDMPLQKINSSLRNWYRSAPELFSNWSLAVGNFYSSRFNDKSFSSVPRGWERIRYFFEQEVKKGLILKSRGNYTTTTDLVFSFPPERIYFEWDRDQKWRQQLALLYIPGNSWYEGCFYPFAEDLSFDIHNFHSGDLKISSRAEDIETSYRDLWYVDYFSSDNLTTAGKLNSRLVKKEVKKGEFGKEISFSSPLRQKRFSSLAQFTDSFSRALNYVEIKNYLTENFFPKFSVLFSDYFRKKEKKVIVTLTSKSKYLNLEKLVLKEKEEIIISVETLIHQVIL